MANKLELIAAVYVDEESARAVLDELKAMHQAFITGMGDAAMVTKDAGGKLNIHETRETTTRKGAGQGALIAGVFGLFFPPSLIASALAGGVIGAAWGKLRDTGIKTGAMEELGGSLEPGNAAVLVLVEPLYLESIVQMMEVNPSKLLRHSFNVEEATQIKDAAFTGDAAASEDAAAIGDADVPS